LIEKSLRHFFFESRSEDSGGLVNGSGGPLLRVSQHQQVLPISGKKNLKFHRFMVFKPAWLAFVHRLIRFIDIMNSTKLEKTNVYLN
jgi:hypothetical protein